MKKIKYFIIGIIVCIVAIIVVIISTNVKNRKEHPEEYHYTDENTISDESRAHLSYLETLNKVNNPDDFFTVVNCVNQYITAINRLNITNKNATEEVKSNLRNNIYKMLSKEYISNNDITQDNVNNYIDDVSDTAYFIPLIAKSIQNNDSSTTRYIVYGIEEDINYKFLRELYIIINTDNINGTYSIEPIVNHNYTNINDVKLEKKDINIEKNSVNEIVRVIGNDEYTSQKYLEYYKCLAIGRPDLAYEFLDNEYKEKRYGTLENYERHIQENLEDIKAIKLEKYGVDRQEDYNEYICQDTYGKIYIFNVKNPMELSIQLDVYTIESDSYKEQYENVKEETKVEMNINKFILMINNQDYETAYNLLDENFKNNYFKTLDDFINYVKIYAYKYNTLEKTSFDVNGNTYICRVELTDATNGQYIDETKGTGGSGYVIEWIFYIKLGKNGEFRVSFDVK